MPDYDKNTNMMPSLRMEDYEPEGLEEYQEQMRDQLTGSSGTVQNNGDSSA